MFFHEVTITMTKPDRMEISEFRRHVERTLLYYEIFDHPLTAEELFLLMPANSLSLAAFRNGQPSAIFVIFITSIWPIIINTAVGIRNIPQDYRNVAAVVQLNPIEFFAKIMIPSAAPYIFTGLRIGIGLSWLAIVAAEMLIGGVGIGFFIWDAWNSSHISEIILALLYVGVIGFLLDRLVALVATFVTHGTSAN